MTDEANRWDRWEVEIRQPAEASKEGLRKIDCGSSTAEYQMAPLHDGRFAIRLKCVIEFTTGLTVPWRAFDTREEAVAYFRAEAQAFFEREKGLRRDREAARKKIMALLGEAGLFGWEEPVPKKPGE